MNTISVPSSELAVGDIVHTHGMRVRLDYQTCSDGTKFGYSGTVLNLDEVLRDGHVPASFLLVWKRGSITRRDAWVVQGNDFVSWIVERGERRDAVE
jgi:hypothetical protein